jgi:hypothetical protein
MNHRPVALLLALSLVAAMAPGGSAPAVEAAEMRVWTVGDTVKVMRSAPERTLTAVHLYGARNEFVSFQIIVTARAGGLTGVAPHPSALTGAAGSVPVSTMHLYRETYQNVTHPSDPAGHTGWWPDGLIPIGRDPIVGQVRNGAPFTVAGGTSQAVWADVHIPAGQKPGQYSGLFTVTGTGQATVPVPVTLTVWDFAIPSQSSLATAFGFDTWGTYQGVYGATWDTNKIVAMTNLYSEAALQMRISMYGIDVAEPSYTYSGGKISDLDWSLWGRTEVPADNGTLDGTGRRFTAVALPEPSNLADPEHPQYSGEDVAFWKATAAYFQSRGWLGRSYLYYDDEPSSASDFATAELHAKLLHEADPRLRYVLTTHYRPDLVGPVNIWAPIINELDSPGYPGPAAYHARQAAGDQVWWYDSDSSADHGQWPDMFIDHPAMNQRVMAWMTWKYGLNGFLYYDTTYAFGLHRNPWDDVYSFGTNGDGTLFYPGKPSVIGGKTEIPCFSLRLMLIRQSLQDYEYLRLLQTHGQAALATAAVNAVVRSSDNFDHSPATLLEERMIMGQELSAIKA